MGYLYNEEQEHLNISRSYHDTCVLPIWKGTTDVLCTDLIRALKHPREGGRSQHRRSRHSSTPSECFQGQDRQAEGAGFRGKMGLVEDSSAAYVTGQI